MTEYVDWGQNPATRSVLTRRRLRVWVAPTSNRLGC